jgi:hypothetical protein
VKTQYDKADYKWLNALYEKMCFCPSFLIHVERITGEIDDNDTYRSLLREKDDEVYALLEAFPNPQLSYKDILEKALVISRRVGVPLTKN